MLIFGLTDLFLAVTAYLGNILTSCHSIWHNDAYWPSRPHRMLKCWIFTNPRWCSAVI